MKLLNEKGITMIKRSNDHSVTSITEEFKESGSKRTFSKYEHDLYNEESDVAEKVIRVKRITMPNKDEKWKIFEDNKVIFIIEGTRLNNKEKIFLRSIEGFNFLISKFKLGIKSFNFLKTEIKQKLSEA